MPKLPLAIATALVLLFAAGCAGEDGAPTTSPAEDSPQATDNQTADTTENVAQSAECDGAPAKVGYSPFANENTWFRVFGESLTEIAEGCGTEVVIADPNTDAAKQVSDIESMITAGVEALFMYPVDPTTISGVVQMAEEQDATVVGVASSFEGSDATVGIDFSETGRISGECGATWLQETKGDKEEFEVAILNAVSLGEEQIEQDAGIREALEAALGAKLNVVTSTEAATEEEGLTATETILQGHPEVDLIVTINDPAALGALSAVQAAGKESQVGIAAAGIDQRVLDAVENGEIVCSVSSVPNEVARRAWDALLTLRQGGSVEERIDVAVEIINSDNAADISEQLYGS